MSTRNPRAFMPGRSQNLGEPAHEASKKVVTRDRLQTRGKPLINTQASSCRKSSKSQAQQHQHAIRPVPIRVAKPDIQLSGKNGSEKSSKAGEDTEHQRSSHNQFCGPDTCRKRDKQRAAGGGLRTGTASEEGMLKDEVIARIIVPCDSRMIYG